MRPCHPSPPQPVPAPQPEPDANQAAENTQYYLRVLHELIDMGTDIARQIHQQSKSPATASEPGTDEKPAPDVTVAFDRITRTIRRTIVLAHKLSEPAKPPADRDPAQHRSAARRRIIRGVEDMIQQEFDGTEADALRSELVERLDSPDLDDDIENRPIADIIKDICHDFGLDTWRGNHPWERRTPEDIKILCARAEMPRAPAHQAWQRSAKKEEERPGLCPGPAPMTGMGPAGP